MAVISAMRKVITILSVAFLIITSVMFGFHGFGLSQNFAPAQSEAQLEELCYTLKVATPYKRVAWRDKKIDMRSRLSMVNDMHVLGRWNGISATVFEDLYIKHCSYLI
ncbi:MAG: hypothetical protein ACJAT1_001148 [Marivirga sp.]|jgi:hypothetical protein